MEVPGEIEFLVESCFTCIGALRQHQQSLILRTPAEHMIISARSFPTYTLGFFVSIVGSVSVWHVSLPRVTYSSPLSLGSIVVSSPSIAEWMFGDYRSSSSLIRFLDLIVDHFVLIL